MNPPIARRYARRTAMVILLFATFPVSAQNFTATSVNGGLWQNSANWSVVPGGSTNGYPNNVGTNVFDVVIPNLVTFDLNADVTIRDLTIQNGLTIQNASNQTLQIDGNVLVQGPVTVNSSLHIVLHGDTSISGAGGVTLTNGSSALNTGTVTIASTAGPGFEASGLPGPTGYTYRNEGTTILNTPGATNAFNSHVIQNTGVFEVRAGSASTINSYTQTSGSTLIRNGASMVGNNFTFNGGLLMASGAALSDASLVLNNTTLEIGDAPNQAASLTIAGNTTPPTNTVMEYDLGGVVQGSQYDVLNLPTGTNLNGVTIGLSLINGFNPGQTDTFTIMTGNNLNGTFVNELGGILTIPDVGTFTVTHSPTSVVLGNFTPIRETATIVLIAAAAAAWRLVRRWAGSSEVRRQREFALLQEGVNSES